MIAEFVAPDWDAPIDVARYLAGVPPAACIKGVFPIAVAAAAHAKKVVLPGARAKYHPFSDVPMREYVPMLLQAATGMFPELPPRQGLRKLGRASRDAFAKSMFGRILLTGFGDIRSALTLYAKAASIATPPARIEVQEVTNRRALLSLLHVYTFMDSHHVGILEKVASGCDLRVVAKVRLISAYDGHIELTW